MKHRQEILWTTRSVQVTVVLRRSSRVPITYLFVPPRRRPRHCVNSCSPPSDLFQSSLSRFSAARVVLLLPLDLIEATFLFPTYARVTFTTVELLVARTRQLPNEYRLAVI